MATTFTVQVTDYLADAVATGDLTITEAMIDLWMMDGANYVINKMPKRLWSHFTTESGDKTTDGYASERPVRVMRESGTGGDYLDCREIPPSSAKDYAGIAPTSDPVYYLESGVIRVLPTPGADPNAFIVVEVLLPTIDASDDSTIKAFPTGLYQAVVKYAVIQCKLREFALVRRNAQDEVEAAVTLLTATATAIGNAKTQYDLVPAIIVEASVEFDKISALLDLGETDSEGDVNTALSAIVTAAGRINDAVLLAQTEIAKVDDDIDTAQTILTDDEDNPRTGAQTSIALGRVANAKNILDKAIAAVQEATTYAGEVNSRLSQAGAKRQEGGSRAQSGSTFLAEAQSTIASGTAYLGEVSGYISQTQVRLADASVYLNMGTQVVADRKILQEDVDSDIQSFLQRN